jgi:hypothetical protein
MPTMARESWTDEWLDEFGKRIDERFDAVQREMRQDFEQVDKRLDRLGDGLEMVQRAIVFGAITMPSAFVAGFVTLAFRV